MQLKRLLLHLLKWLMLQLLKADLQWLILLQLQFQ
jgi:hypothetical protein